MVGEGWSCENDLKLVGRGLPTRGTAEDQSDNLNFEGRDRREN